MERIIQLEGEKVGGGCEIFQRKDIKKQRISEDGIYRCIRWRTFILDMEKLFKIFIPNKF
jgi:hypothetical protein